MTQHKAPKERVAELSDIAQTLADKHGYLKVTREMIAAQADVSPGLVSHHLGTMANLRRSIVRQALARESLRIIAQAVANNDPHVRGIDEALKKKALKSLAG